MNNADIALIKMCEGKSEDEIREALSGWTVKVVYGIPEDWKTRIELLIAVLVEVGLFCLLWHFYIRHLFS